MRKIRIMVLGLTLTLASMAAARDVTFISTSDCHYRQLDHRLGNHTALNRASVEEMNNLVNVDWPDKLGGGKVGRPRGVVVLGDVIDEGDTKEGDRIIAAEQYKFFRDDFGLDGTDGLLKYPVFEGWGNHDGPPEGKGKCGFSFQAELKKRNQLRLEKKLISNVSTNGLHYSWDWDDVHFVQCNIYPADQQRAGVHYGADWHNPQGALSFLKADLAEKVGSSGRPVVLLAHMGFDTDWWIEPDWKDLWDAVKQYNIALYIFGHTGTGVWTWPRKDELTQWNVTKPWQVINDGHTDAGFFVIQITDDQIRFAYRKKDGLTNEKQADGKLVPKWGGQWSWTWLTSVKLAPKTAVSPEAGAGK